MTTRKIVLAALTAMFMTGIAAPVFAEDHVDTNDAIFETKAASQIQPVSLPQIYVETQTKTLSEEAFDLTDGR